MATKNNSYLQYGSQGDDVVQLQKILNSHGYGLDEDGIFGGKTRQAVRDFQQKNGLTVDGIVGSQTTLSLTGGEGLWFWEPPTTNTTDNNTTDNTSTPATSSKPTYTAPTYTAPTYKESDTVKQAQAALNTQLANKPGAYQSQWQTQLNDTIDKILNREKFSYDLNGDALYQQYKDKYIQQGKMAMGDAIGQASAMTGGYGNSYAQSVGQQAYQAQLNNLNDIVPELYQMAYDKYNQEGQDLYNQYSMLGTQEEQDYGRYRDEMSDWLTERDYLANRYDAERDYDYNKFVDDRNFGYNQFTDNRNFGYGEYRDAMSDYQWQEAYDYQKDRDKVADEQWEQEYALNALKGGYTVDKSGNTEGGTKVGGTLTPITTSDNDIPEGIVTKVQNFTTEKGQADYLADEVNKGNITEDQAVELLNQHGVTDLTSRRWEMVDDGGINWLGIGIDADAKVRDEYGKTYTLAELRKELKKTMSTKEANAYIKELEKKLNI